MNVKNVEKENGSAKVTVEIAKDEFQTALDKAYAKIRKDIMIPGFRKGKAPRKFVERMYGSQVFYEDAVSEIFPDIYEAAIIKQELKAVGQPSVTDMQTPEDGSVVLTVSTELYPEVTLGEYKGIEVPKESISISKAEVDAELARMQERNARIETVYREAKTGDTVVLDFEGFVDGVAFEGGKGESYPLLLGSGYFIPGFEEQVAGARTGEERDIHVTFPTAYTPELAGKDATFHIKVHEITRRSMPTLDDAFARAQGFEELSHLRRSVMEQAVAKKQSEAAEQFANDLIGQVLAGMEVELPDAMVENQLDGLIQELRGHLESQGVQLEQYLESSGTSMEDLRAHAREQAAGAARFELAMTEIARLEGIDVTDDDVEQKYAELSAQYQLSRDLLRQQLPPLRLRHDLKLARAQAVGVDSARRK